MKKVAVVAFLAAGLALCHSPAQTPSAQRPAGKRKPLARGAKTVPAPPAAVTDHKPYTETIPGTTVKFDMVSIPGGTFTMGSPAGEAGRHEDEGPQHKVTVAPFWMSKNEVRWDEYQMFALEQDWGKAADQPALDAVTRPTPPYADPTFGMGLDGYPVLSVTHHAAMEYCAWLSAKTGRNYRLPTEAEWEYAARAGTSTAYFFGGPPGRLAEYAWYAANSKGRSQPVGKKKPNPWGLHDIYGNVAEWVLDRYSKSFYASAPEIGPVLLPETEEYPHVARGGSWDDRAERLRSAARLASHESWNRRDPQEPQSIWWLTDATTVGFRIVRAVDEQENLKGFRSKTVKGAGTARE